MLGVMGIILTTTKNDCFLGIFESVCTPKHKACFNVYVCKFKALARLVCQDLVVALQMHGGEVLNSLQAWPVMDVGSARAGRRPRQGTGVVVAFSTTGIR
jgi:hypothetical protein